MLLPYALWIFLSPRGVLGCCKALQEVTEQLPEVNYGSRTDISLFATRVQITVSNPLDGKCDMNIVCVWRR